MKKTAQNEKKARPKRSAACKVQVSLMLNFFNYVLSIANK